MGTQFPANKMKSFLQKIIDLFNIDKKRINALHSNIKILGECEEEYINAVFQNLERIFTIYKILVLLLLVVSLVFLVLSNYQFAFFGLIVVICIVYFFVETVQKLDSENSENICVVKAKCIKRKLGGYRLQYHKFNFEYDGDKGEKENFFIFSSSKTKFFVDDDYILLLKFDKEAQNEINRVSALSVVKK